MSTPAQAILDELAAGPQDGTGVYPTELVERTGLPSLVVAYWVARLVSDGRMEWAYGWRLTGIEALRRHAERIHAERVARGI